MGSEWAEDARAMTAPAQPDATASLDARALAQTLRRSVRGEVRFDAGSRATYATDASNYRQVPLGVVVPRTTDDVLATLDACHRAGAPVLARGGGTSLAGQACNVAVVLDFSKYLHRVLELDPDRKLARVQPGVVLDDLRAQAARFNLTFGPDPATHNRCTLGGMIGNNACGVHSIRAGMTADNVEQLEVITHDGLRLRVGATDDDELARALAVGGRRAALYAGLRALRDRYAEEIRTGFPDIPRRVSGYNLPELLPERGFQVARALAGSEGTCVTVLEATLRLVESPPYRVLVVLGFPDIYQAAERVPEIMGYSPAGLEGFDGRLLADVRAKRLHPHGVALLPPGGGWLLVEFDGWTAAEARAYADALVRDLSGRPGAPAIVLLDDTAAQHHLWLVRESALGATARAPGQPDTWPGWEDSAVAPDRFGGYLRDLRRLMDRFGYSGAFYGHFGQGCLHTRMDYDFSTAAGVASFERFMHEAAALVVSYGGSLSGEHGDGQARGELLPLMFGPELMRAFGEFKALWDPTNLMNPGKLVHAYRADEHLRLGATYRPKQLRTHFRYPDDDGNFARAMTRCVGVGKCRREGGGVMCPSYMVTREERHSTRGRARLLFEMLQGDVLRDGWRDPHVKEALDLCLACKGCKSECPVQVDMATYKAEFLSHYYAGRLRPASAYAMGLIFRWARLAARAPRLANAATQTPPLAALAKRLLGIAPQRRFPAFAPRTFKQQFRLRPVASLDRPEVLLWPDTFSNHFHPEVALAAVDELEAAGYRVIVPQAALCCGRPLYDFGMLDTAKRLLRQVLDTLRPQIRAGVPLVGLEPSCVSVFRDELVALFPDDQDAQRLRAQTFLLAEFLERAPDYEPPRLESAALLQGHCHQQAVLGMGAEERLLARMGVRATALDAGCCGMAGAFGFERQHYDVSMACGERVLLPAVRAASAETLIIADGFSCSEQIAQTTDRRALHLAQVLRLARQHQAAATLPPGVLPETLAAQRTSLEPSRRLRFGRLALASVGLTLVLGGLARWARTRTRSRTAAHRR
ncbi:MAG: FAD-binding and (Fe-S)-binding domain-containing protein [Ktedonobacterales bacterium]